jgi:hypothetical protein
MRNLFNRRRHPSKPHVRRRLAVGRLEDRLTPSTFTVNSLLDTASPPAGVTTLRSAIAAADADNVTDPTHPDVINFSVTGTIALNSALPNLTDCVAIQGPGASSLTVLGPGISTQQRLLTLTSSANSTFSGLTLDGNGFDNAGIAVGGNASLVLQDATIQNAFSSGNGGGLSMTGGSVTVTRVRFLGDGTEMSGAGIANVGGTLTVRQSTFDSGFADLAGGGIYDSAGSGGGGGLTVVGSTFSNNTAGSGGGGLCCSGASATVADCTFFDNVGAKGGGVAVTATSVPGALSLLGSTVAGNSVGSEVANGGGFYIGAGCTATLQDTIVAGNTASDVAGPTDSAQIYVLTGSFDLIGAGVIGNSTGVSGLLNGNGNQIGTAAQPINPRLGPLQNNGGPVKTMALLPGSPALDRGGPAVLLDALTNQDACGNSRVMTQFFIVPPAGGDGRDIGAFELSPQVTPTILAVNTLSDAAGTPPAGMLTLRQAILAANGAVPLSTLPAAQVIAGSAYFDQIQIPVEGTIGLTSPLPAIGAGTAVFLQGPGAGTLSIFGDAASDRLLTVSPGAAADVDGLTLDGNGLGNSGIAVGASGSLILEDATIQNTIAAGNGGGLLITGGSATVIRGRFVNDYTESSGGGIAEIGGALTVSQSTFDHNNASNSGAGLFVTVAPGGANIVNVLGSTFSNNLSGSHGGGIGVAGASATISDCTFSGNNAEAGGGIAAFQSTVPTTLAVIASTVAGNSIGLGGAGAGLYASGDSSVTLQDSLVATNSGGDIYGPIVATGDHNLVGDGTFMSGLVNGVNGNQVGTAASPINPLLGPLADNGGPTQTMALLSGSPAIDAGSNPANLATDQRIYPRVVGAAADIGAFEVQAPPTVTSVVVNGGAAQRSMVTTIAVTFSTQVIFAPSPAAAFSLTRVSDGTAVLFTANVQYVNGAAVVTLNGFTGPASQNGSLADGRYTLRVISTQVTANGVALDGNNDGVAGGDYVSPTDTYGGQGLHLFRLFGDCNGDGVVDSTDLGQFRSTFNANNTLANYLWYLDANGDGVVDSTDLGQFRARFNANIFI